MSDKSKDEPRIHAGTPVRHPTTTARQPVDRPGRYRELKAQVTTLRSLRRPA